MGEPEAARVPGMLLVGAGTRNAGKTAFLDSVVRRVSRERPIAGVKVTVIREGRGSGCARGGDGCGVCLSLGETPWILARENGENPTKDTARLLAAGASPVYWLRVREAFMAEAREALLAAIGPGLPIAVESNTFRFAVEPDLFLVLLRKGESAIKPSCQAVRRLADREVIAAEDGFDPCPDAVHLTDGLWTMRQPATAIVLAGGSSTRMGRDKAMVDAGGVPLIQRIVDRLSPLFEEVIVSARGASDYAFLGVRVVPDRAPGVGPLMGLRSALEASRHDVNVVVPCDVAEVPHHLLARLLREVRDADAAVPCHPNGFVEPLIAAYRRSVVPAIEAALARGDRRAVSFHGMVRVTRVPLPAGTELSNFNTPEDLQRLLPGPRGDLGGAG